MMTGPMAGAPRWLKFVVPPLVAVLIGVGIVIASSSASLTRDHRGINPAVPTSASPSPASTSPPPTVTEAGILGAAPRLLAAGSSDIAATTGSLAAGSADGGKTWSQLTPPSNGAGIAVDPSNPLHAISGGSRIQFTSDGGKTWQGALRTPPGTGPYQVLAISPFDSAVWFFVHQEKLLRTRDGSASWRDLTALPALSSPVLVTGHVLGEFFLASGGRVFEMIDNGQQVVEQPPLPAGVVAADLAAVGGNQLPLLARGGNSALYLLKGSAWAPLTGVTGGPIGAGANVVLVGNGGGKLNSTPGAISYSLDGGITWKQAVGLPSDQTVEAIAGQPGSTAVYAYCFGGDMYVSADGGASWTLLSRALRSRSG